MRRNLGKDRRRQILLDYILDFGLTIPLAIISSELSKSAKYRAYWAGSMPGARTVAELGYKASVNKGEGPPAGLFLNLYPLTAEDRELVRERFKDIEIMVPPAGLPDEPTE